MASLSVKLPLKYSSIDGFVMNKSIQRMLQQNLKMLLLTNPGERVMAPTFGVGLKMYLFSNQYEGIQDRISTKIHEQVKIYLPAIVISRLDFSGTNLDTNTLSLKIYYHVPGINVRDLVAITI